MPRWLSVQVAPSLAINYAAYETMRSRWLAATDRDTPSVTMSLACGSAAGLISSTATFPLDLIRRRLQLVGGGGGGSAPGFGARTYRGVLREVWVKEGLRGLYAGILPEYYKASCVFGWGEGVGHVWRWKETCSLLLPLLVRLAYPVPCRPSFLSSCYSHAFNPDRLSPASQLPFVYTS